MSQALFTSMTGLNVAQQSINVVANNVANINTTAYKSADARFATLFSNTLTAGNAPTATAGGTNPKQIGLGVKLEAITRNFNTGSFLSTDISGDSMISGRGYYTVMDASSNVYLTRDGAFTLDANGDMITATGNKVLGAAGIANEEASQIPVHIPQSITPTVSGADLTSKTLGELNNAKFTAGTIVFGISDGTNASADNDPLVATITENDVANAKTV
ncbi:flagellar hook-basal body complex protein, partial [bacterium]|nr:flagellar hook-basal body complex protein [bacterium]